jgi:hypothetical protein
MFKKTKQEFCKRYPQYKRLRRTDPIQFKVLFFQWYRDVIAANYYSSKRMLKS